MLPQANKWKAEGKSEHRHEWDLTLEWNEINDDDALCPTAICKKRGCKEKLQWDEIERRLNATEALSAEDAKRASFAWGLVPLGEKLKDYARILEGGE